MTNAPIYSMSYPLTKHDSCSDLIELTFKSRLFVDFFFKVLRTLDFINHRHDHAVEHISTTATFKSKLCTLNHISRVRFQVLQRSYIETVQSLGACLHASVIHQKVPAHINERTTYSGATEQSSRDKKKNHIIIFCITLV